MSDQDAVREDVFETASDLLRRTTEFLTLCTTHADAALESEDVHELIRALEQIKAGANDLDTTSEGSRAKLAALHSLITRKSA